MLRPGERRSWSILAGSGVAALAFLVRQHGVLLGEQPFGVPPERGRFPVRNRIIAALADVVVVVEATLTGGSRITAERALDYGRPVLAVPGSRRNPAAAGCNALLADGAQPLLEPSDVLLALGLTPGGRRLWHTSPAPGNGPQPSANGAAVLKALSGEAAHPDQLASRAGLDAGQVALAPSGGGQPTGAANGAQSPASTMSSSATGCSASFSDSKCGQCARLHSTSFTPAARCMRACRLVGWPIPIGT